MSDQHPTHEPDPAGHGDASTLGPIDIAAWGAGILGIAVAVVMAVAFVMATSGVG